MAVERMIYQEWVTPLFGGCTIFHPLSPKKNVVPFMEPLARKAIPLTSENPCEHHSYIHLNPQIPTIPFSNETWMNFHEIKFYCFVSPCWLTLTSYFWVSLLCCWNDARCFKSLWSGSFWNCLPRLSSSLRPNHCCRNFNKQDGPYNASLIWTNARPSVSTVYGKLCQRRWLLPLLLRRCPWMWSHHSSRHLRAGMSSYSRSSALRPHPTTRENRVCSVRVKYI